MLLTVLMAVGGLSSAWAGDTYEILYGVPTYDDADGTTITGVTPQTDFTGDAHEIIYSRTVDEVTYYDHLDANGTNCTNAMPMEGSMLNLKATWNKYFSSVVTAGKVYFAGNYTVSPNNSYTIKIVDSNGYVIYQSSQQSTNGNADQDVATICGTAISGYCRQARSCHYGVKSLCIDLDTRKVTYDLIISSGNNSYSTQSGTIDLPEEVTDVKGMTVSKTSWDAYLDNVMLYSVVSSSFIVTTQYVDESGNKIFDDVQNEVSRGESFTPDYKDKETYNPGFYTYSYQSGGDQIANVTSDQTVTIVYSKTLKAAYSTYRLGENVAFMEDYIAGTATNSSTATNGRYTPVIGFINNNHYLTVDQNQRNNNGATVTFSTVKDKVSAGTDFTLSFDLQLTAAKDRPSDITSFTILDNANANAILKFTASATGSTTWKINDSDNLTVTMDPSIWYNVKITRSNSDTYCTIKDHSTGENVLSKQTITQLSETGGLGNMQLVTARYKANIALDNILVRNVVESEDIPAAATTYTIKYTKEDGTAIDGKADVVVDTYANEQVTATAEQMATFELNDKKYVYKEGNETITCVEDASSNVITLKFYEYSKWNYTVTTSYNNSTLPYQATGYVWEDEAATSINVNYPRYQLSGTQLVEKSPISNELRQSIKVTSNDFTTDFAYTAVSGKTNVTLLSEAENLNTGLSASSPSLFTNRCSGSKIIYGSKANLFSLEPGKYIVTLGAIGGASNQVNTFNIYTADKDSQSDENKVGTGSCTGNFLTLIPSEEFTLTKTTVISFTMSNGNSSRGLDLVYVQKTGEYVPPTIDITDLYLTNPSFETGNTDGWTVGESIDTGARSTTNDTYKMTNSEGNYLFNTWWQGIPITQTIQSLPAGTYTLSSVVASDGATVYMISGDDSNEYVYTETTNAGVGIPLKKTFTLTEAADFKIGAVGGADGTAGEHKEYVAGGYWWYKADAFKLKLILEDDATIPAAIVAKLEAANPVNQGTVGSVVAAAYTQAKSTFESNATLANYEAYLAAVATYNMSVAQYAAIESESGALPIESTDGWAISTKNGTLARNTWSTEGNSDGSGMTTPFIQDWVGSGTPLAGGEDGGKLYYRLLLTPGETYAVTALVRAFNEAGTGVTGATYYVGDDEKSIDELGSACTGNYSEKGKFGTFSCIGTVGEDGVLEFGVKLASNSPINWLSIKDIVIKESSDVKPTGITLSQTSATLTTGDALTITATIAPDDASDQTIQWTSSNEAVATVSGGVVAAVSAGTATITAKAVAGNNVTATATITVADAPALAYATAISGTGQYLLRNVASGKYLNAGNAWGTQATLSPQGVLLTATLADGTYKLTDIVASTNGLGSDGYCDNGTPVALTVTAVAGKNNVYTISPAAGQYVAGQAGSTVVTMTATDAASTLAQWQFIGENELKKNISVATAENPFDVTYYIMDPNFSRNNGYLSSWTMTANNKNLGGGDNTNFVAESWHSSNGFDLNQTLTVPNGTYRLRAQAAGSGTPAEVYVYANDVTTPFTTIANGENSMSAMSASFTAGLYNTEWAEVTVTDNKLKVGAKTTRTDTWCVFDNFQLQFVGYVPVTAINATIDKNEIGTLETATITASVYPETASFTGITYTSSNESVATVSADGVVTAVAAGQATITVKAEVENVEKTIAVTVIESVLATADDYAALNAAINSHVMGFLEGEYAPYNNAAESFATVTAAKAIDQTVDNLQSTVQAATQAITNATWVVNTEEVNAFYDGTFAAATNNGAPNGWRMSNNTLGGDYHSRAFVGDDRLVEFNDTKSGLFLRFDNTNSSRGSMYYYGDTEGYTMPLKANTYYRVTVDFAGWGSTGKPLRMNVTGPEGFSAVNQQYNTSVRADNANNTPQQFNIVFQTAGEGNYVINFQTPGADTNTHNVVISNLKLFTEPESSATLAVTAAKYGTFIAPFDVTLPEGVTAYTVTDGDQLTMTEVTNNTIPANTPVVVSSEEVVSETVKGYSLAIKDSYTMEALTGTYVDIDAPNGSYILQNQNGKVGFYKVDYTQAKPKVRANRAYLSSGSNARSSFLFEDSETVTAINAVKALTEGEALIYDMNGVQQPRLKKGMNIIRTKDGRTQKVMVR